MTLQRAVQELRSYAGTQFYPRTVEALLAEIEAPSIARSGDQLPPGTGVDQAAHPIDGTHPSATVS
jgi:hypothetical protein